MSIATIRLLRRGVALTWVLLMTLLICVVALYHFGPLVGRTFVVMRGDSMAPAIPVGSLAAVRPVDASDVRAGDVVAVPGTSGGLVLHRVVGVDADQHVRRLELRGDAPGSATLVVHERHLAGRVDVSLPLLGFPLGMLTTASGILAWASLLVTLPLAL